MPDTKISALPLLTGPAADDMLPVADVSAVETKRYPLGAMLPVADSANVTIDTTTYDNPITGNGKLTTLVVATDDDTPYLAIAGQGEAFPRMIWSSDPRTGFFFGDGSQNPYTSGARIQVDTSAGIIKFLIQTPNGALLRVGAHAIHVPAYIDCSVPIAIGGESGGAILLHAGQGNPNLNEGGYLGDLFIRQDPTGANETIYRCTADGDAGVATWVGIL